MSYLVLYDEDKILKIDTKEEAIEFIEDKIEDNINEYCDDYDIDIEDASPERINELAFGAGYDSGEIKLYSINKILRNISKANLDDEDKEDLIQNLQLDILSGNLDDYQGLEEVLEYISEERVY